VLTALLLAVVVLAGTGGDILVARVMKKVSRGERWTWRAAPQRIASAVLQGQMWMAVGLMILAFLAFITVLSWADVSLAAPATAANYIVGVLGAKFLLKEKVSKGRWAGMLLVAAGVALVCSAR
jgi:bacterial/archaeal transporter family protein